MLKILDCSHYQVVTDWKKLSKDVDYVICKATQGISYVDPTFADKMANARKNNIPFGSYHFAQGLDAEKEAKFYLKTVGELRENDLLCLDYEIHLSDPVAWCKTFLDYCRDQTGVRPLLYINTSTKKSFDWSRAKNYPLWQADYGINEGKAHSIDMPYVLHQYTSNGTVAGIATRVDLSDTYLYLEDLKKYGKTLETPGLPVSSPVVEIPVKDDNNVTTQENVMTPQNAPEPPKIDEVVNVPITVIEPVVTPSVAPQGVPQPQSFWSWLIQLINLFK